MGKISPDGVTRDGGGARSAPRGRRLLPGWQPRLFGGEPDMEVCSASSPRRRPGDAQGWRLATPRCLGVGTRGWPPSVVGRPAKSLAYNVRVLSRWSLRGASRRRATLRRADLPEAVRVHPPTHPRIRPWISLWITVWIWKAGRIVWCRRFKPCSMWCPGPLARS